MLKSNVCCLVLIFYFCLLLPPFGLSTSSNAKAAGNGDVFMSSSEMNKVFLMEQELVSYIFMFCSLVYLTVYIQVLCTYA